MILRIKSVESDLGRIRILNKVEESSFTPNGWIL